MDYKIVNNTVATFPIRASNSVGDLAAATAGDVFEASSSDNKKLTAVVAKSEAGGPSLVLTPIVAKAEGIKVKLTDMKSMIVYEFGVDIVDHPPMRQIMLDMTGATLVPQTKPVDKPAQGK